MCGKTSPRHCEDEVRSNPEFKYNKKATAFFSLDCHAASRLAMTCWGFSGLLCLRLAMTCGVLSGLLRFARNDVWGSLRIASPAARNDVWGFLRIALPAAKPRPVIARTKSEAIQNLSIVKRLPPFSLRIASLRSQ
ncbi:MAG: hypothetical protein LBE71_03935 [Dysgonamonadaceae bacterium]|nr:hypothetical protein [Dysgonamonadaceae bacterium]